MKKNDIADYIDHTLLKPTAGWKDIQKLCDEAKEYHTASVCVPPIYVPKIKKAYADDVNICTVIGFPLGYSVTQSKVIETRQAVENGASEIDMVINIAAIKDHDDKTVADEILAIRKAADKEILKVIIETCYLSEDEKIRLCKIVSGAGADFIKTSTGYGTEGAKLSDIELFRTYCRKDLKIKAAGGIRTFKDAMSFINAGCHRIGTSAAAAIIEESRNSGN